MNYVPGAGGAMLIPSGPAGDHLFVIITRLCTDNSHLLVSISSIRDGRHYDPACVLNVGDHPFIKRPSYVVYSKPEQRPANFVARLVASGAYIEQPPVPLEVLKRICDGMESSDFIRPWALSYFLKNDPR